jgi:dethiobiotin synthetase
VKRVIFVTGSDTGVGKTVVTTMLTQHLCALGHRVAALKPLCSGGREDAVALHAALGGALSLDEINPWHFYAPLAPALAARKEHRRVLPAEVLAQVRQAQARFDAVLVEGAGGLLSPLGVGFNARILIARLRATPVVVCPNRLGAVNQVLLVLAALPLAAARRAQIVLVTQKHSDASARSNAALLAEHLGRERVHRLPWLCNAAQTALARRVVAGLLRRIQAG